jgi:hypothetical protein
MPDSVRIHKLTFPGAGSFRPTRLDAISLAVVTVCALATYWRATGYYFSSDDFEFLARATGLRPYPDILGPLGSRIVSTRFYFESLYRGFGLNSDAYHWASVVVHTINAALLYLLTRRWIGAIMPAVVAGLLFATFDQAFTAVFWVSGVQDLLATTFLLASALIWVSRTEKGMIITAASAGAMALSLLCKEIGILFPLVLLLMAWSRRNFHKESLKGLAPHFALSALMLVLVLKQSIEVPKGGAYETGITVDIIHNLATYIAWTADFVHPFKDKVAIINHDTWKWALGVAALVLIYLTVTRGGLARMEWTALAWYAVMLTPVLPLLRHTYLYYLYPAAPGVAILAGLSAYRLTAFMARRWGKRGRSVGWATVLSTTGLLCVIAALNVRAREATYLDEELKMPQDHVLRNAVIAENAVSTFMELDVPEDADLILINPFSTASYNVTEEETDRGSTTRTPLVERALREGLVLRLYRPNLGKVDFTREMDPTWENRHGVLFGGMGRCLYMGTGDRLWANLGLVYLGMVETPDNDRAVSHCRRALELNPTNSTANLIIGIDFISKGKYQEARSHLQRAVKHATKAEEIDAALRALEQIPEGQPAQ